MEMFSLQKQQRPFAFRQGLLVGFVLIALFWTLVILQYALVLPTNDAPSQSSFALLRSVWTERWNMPSLNPSRWIWSGDGGDNDEEEEEDGDGKGDAALQLDGLDAFRAEGTWQQRRQRYLQHLRADDDQVWRKRNRTTVHLALQQISEMLAEQAVDEGVEPDRSDSEPVSTAHAAAAPPIVILGTAGTGTRVFNRLLTEAGIQMSRIVNSQKDSRVFIDLIKNHPAFGKPAGFDHATHAPLHFLFNRTVTTSSEEIQSLMDWIHANGRLDYDVEELKSFAFYEPLMNSMKDAKRILALEFEARSSGEPPSDIPQLWGFKEPQGVYVLPLLLELYRQEITTSQQPLTIVHVLRDGRDIAFSKQQRRKYQNYYIQKLHPYTRFQLQHGEVSEEWAYAVAVAAAWEFVNLSVRKWASRHAKKEGSWVRYVTVRLEDVCLPGRRARTVKKFYRDIGVREVGEERLKALLEEVIDEGRCHVGKYLSKDPPLVELLESVISKGLEAFQYRLTDETMFPVDLLATVSPHRPTAEGTHPFLMLTFINEDYFELWIHFLRHLHQSLPRRDLSSDERIKILVATSQRHMHQVLSSPQHEHPRIPSKLLTQYRKTLVRLEERLVVIPYHIAAPDVLWSEEPRLTSGFGNVDIWRFRLQATQALLEKNWTVLIVDVDALFVKNVQPLLPWFPAEGAEGTAGSVMLQDGTDGTISLADLDFVASRGRFPYELGDKWGQTVCMGWIWLRPTDPSKTLIKLAVDRVESFHDDQSAFNHAMDELWSWSWKNATLPNFSTNATLLGTAIPYQNSNVEPARALVLPFALVARYCKDVVRAYRKQHPESLPISDARVLRSELGEALVMHCYTPKSGEDKMFWFRRWGLLVADELS